MNKHAHLHGAIFDRADESLVRVLGQQNGLAGCLSRFERSVGIPHLIQGKTLPNRDLHIPIFDLAKQVTRHFLAGLMLRNMGKKRRTCQLQGSTCGQCL